MGWGAPPALPRWPAPGRVNVGDHGISGGAWGGVLREGTAFSLASASSYVSVIEQVGEIAGLGQRGRASHRRLALPGALGS